MEAMEDIVIVGAGVGGLATALGLHRLGLRSLVLESSHTLRSSNFTITTKQNAWNALDALGVGNSLRQQHARIHRVLFSSASSGSVTAELLLNLQGNGSCGKINEVRSVIRNELVATLAKELPEGTIRLSSEIVSILEMGKLKVLHLADGSTIKTKVLIGCDGVYSVVAKWLHLKAPKHEGRYAFRGFATFLEGHGYKLEYSQHNGKGYRAGFLPCNENTVYWFFSWTPDHGNEIDEDPVRGKEFVLRKMSSDYYVPEEILKVIQKSDPGDMGFSPIMCKSPFNLLWSIASKGNVCVAGDAFHPMAPDIGQGGSLALEEGVILARLLKEAFAAAAAAGSGAAGEYERIEAALHRYGKERRWRCFQVAMASYMIGYILESRSAVVNFLRDFCFSGLVAKLWLWGSDFDCGTLKMKQY